MFPSFVDYWCFPESIVVRGFLILIGEESVLSTRVFVVSSEAPFFCTVSILMILNMR